MGSLQQILIHGNFISGTLPATIDNLQNLISHKLGRNPISGVQILIRCSSIMSVHDWFPLTFSMRAFGYTDTRCSRRC